MLSVVVILVVIWWNEVHKMVWSIKVPGLKRLLDYSYLWKVLLLLNETQEDMINTVRFLGVCLFHFYPELPFPGRNLGSAKNSCCLMNLSYRVCLIIE